MDVISLLILISAILVGVNIGANSASNAIGVIVGSDLLSFKKAAFLVSSFMLAGALLQGGAVIETVGSDLIPSLGDGSGMNYFEYDPRIVLSALLAALVFVGIATYMSIPVATSHTMIGSIMGALFAVGVMDEINQGLLYALIASWIMTPIAAIIAAYLIYAYFTVPLTEKLDFLSFNRIFMILLLAGSVFLSYSLGANNVGNAVGPMLSSGVMADQVMAVFLIGISMGVGASVFSRRVVETIGKKITALGPAMAFTAQVAAALVIYSFTLLGMPISSTQAVVGAVMGVGLTKGVRTVNLKTIRYILIGWVLTPLMSAALSVLIYSSIVGI